MRKFTIQSLLLIAASIILLSSCSQVRQVTTSSNHKLHLIKADRNTTATAKVEAPKATDKKELNSLPPKDQDISGLQVEKNSAPKLHPVKSPMLHPSISKESKTNSKSGFVDKKFQQIQKVIDRITVISNASNSTQLLPYGHSDTDKYLKLWIIFLAAAILFWIIAVVAYSSSVSTGSAGVGSGLIFSILAFACSVLATVFFIIWLVKLFS
jgi:hypothetical protein